MERRDRPRIALPAVAAGAGGLWGYLGYRVLWGLTPIVVTPRFSFSRLGLVAFLPVRLVLRSIRLVEEHVVHHPFRFAENHAWIGLIAAVVGAVLVLGVAHAIRWTFRRLTGAAPSVGPARGASATAE